MRAARYLMPTLRDAPADAVAASHVLLVRSGMIRQIGAGLWSWLPLGWRSLHQAMQIIREEMDRIGGQEMLMPVVHPADLWRQTGRYDIPELFKLKDRVGRDLVLAMTHEEIIAFHAARELRSYRDLPQIWYHIQTKERDEPRPQGGVLRTREFIMKDSYTLDRDDAGLDEQYALHELAYDRIFSRAGLRFYKVESDTGMMGGRGAHEYMAPSAAGEDAVALCDRGDYAANVEMATSPLTAPDFGPAGQPEEVETPNVATIDALASFLGIDPRTTSKAMPVVADDGQMVLALVRGDRRLHELKLRKALGQDFRPAQPDEIEAAFGAKPGSIGPLSVDGRRVGRIVADATLRDGVFVAGANRTGWHVKNTVVGRDYQAEVADIQLVEDGDPCPLCGGTLHVEPMIEIGNIFKLGTRYSAAMGANYLAEDGTEHPIVMGSYGIGPARIVAAAAEQGHDDAGLIWPPALAPFGAWIVAIGDEAGAFGDRLTDELAEHGIAAMVDDRSQSPGAKFADADLIGAPLRVTIGKRTVSEGTVDVRVRKTGASETLPLAEAAARLAALSRELAS
jgi:prolyl-tRNA synthetase